MIEHMKKLKDNPLLQIMILLGLIAGLILFMVIDSRTLAPKRITSRNVTLSSEEIPRQMDDVKILFFSDLEYGTFMNEERLENLCTIIRNAGADTVVFGGDLFDYDAEVNETAVQLLTEKLKAIKAPLGKFAVLGDNDHKSEDMVNTVTSILNEAGFEILNNRSVRIHNKEAQSIALVGLDNGLNGMQDIESAYANVSSAGYVITVCHTPDTASKVPADLTDYFLAGHSHGGQVYYIFGASYTPAMATEYMRGIHTVHDIFTLDITNGVGTTGSDVRFLSYPEVVLYRLSSEAPLPTPTPSAKPQESADPQPSLQPEETEAPAQEETPAEEVPAEEPAEEQAEEPVQEEIPEDTDAGTEEPAYEEPAYEEPADEVPADEEPFDESGETSEEG